MTSTSPRLASAITSRSASAAAAATRSKASQPAVPKRSNEASWILAATQAGPAAAIARRQNARAPSAPPGTRRGSGSRPSTTWLARGATAAASRSPNPLTGGPPATRAE